MSCSEYYNLGLVVFNSKTRSGFLRSSFISLTGRDTPRTPQPQTPNNSQTSTCRNFTNINNINKAVEYLKLLKLGEQFIYQEVANKYGCSRSALSRRWRGVSRDKATNIGQQQALHLQQETELVEYICTLHERGLAPTREMIQNFASEIAGRGVSLKWVDRFLHRNHDHLIIR